MNPLVVLGDSAPLPAQVATFLLGGKKEGLVDLGDTLVLIPTAGAGRAIRRELAKRGVLSPQFRLPLDALLPGGVAVASRLEREAVWTSLLDPARRRTFEPLVPRAVPLDAADDRLGVAARLCLTCDQLAEAGKDPASGELAGLFDGDNQRWETFGRLHAQYLAALANHGLRDPNNLRIEQAQNPDVAPGLRRIIVACIPDLPVIVERWLAAMSAKGISVDVLAWSPAEQSAHLNAWGRPVVDWWKSHYPTVDAECLVAANDPATEAGLLLDHAGARRESGYGLFAAAPESVTALAQEVAWRDAEPHLPEGRALAQTESAEIFLGWNGFVRSRRLRDLRVLLQKPCFLSWFIFAAEGIARINAEEALVACDRLVGERLCGTVDAAVSWLEHAQEPRNKGALAEFLPQKWLVLAVQRLLGLHADGFALLAEVNRHRGAVKSGSIAALELAAMGEVLKQIEASPVLRGLEGGEREAVVRNGIARGRIFPRASADAIEIQGWLEAPWSSAETLIVAGCREGALPAGTHEDSFLPDAARARLGLVTQDARFARDAFLLSCLRTSHPGERLRLGYSRFRGQGEPNRPSRLLFGCENSELPRRSTLLFKPDPPTKPRAAAAAEFKLHIPEPAEIHRPPESIHVTAFRNYLQCPLRFYLRHMLGLRTMDSDAREISAADYGTVVHKVLEEFAADESLRGLRDADEIVGALDQRLDEVVPRYYGADFSPVVRVQIEGMRFRLRAAALTESVIRRDGWVTMGTEYKVGKEDKLLLGGLAISGTMDRVDRHPELGLRILDYKTYSQHKNPARTHIGPRRVRENLPQANLETFTKNGRSQARSWMDLQLPLYAWLARRIWPEDAARGVKVGYFLLPSDLDSNKDALEFFELDEAMQNSAESCAARIAELIRKGVFWPPAPVSEVEYDDFADWFMNGDPREIIDGESIKRLQGAS